MCMLVSVVLIMFAASPQVSFNDKLLFEFPDIDIIIKSNERKRTNIVERLSRYYS